ncbi:MAG: hypothetical protein NTV80_12230, partial [Verrucomicrobia bacterium]|nr:hypothetical protein [Verrucomicrobiota bacterium]
GSGKKFTEERLLNCSSDGSGKADSGQAMVATLPPPIQNHLIYLLQIIGAIGGSYLPDISLTADPQMTQIARMTERPSTGAVGSRVSAKRWAGIHSSFQDFEG